MPRGKLIVFEGLDRAGKSTQCLALVQRLQQDGHRVKHMRFPDRTTVIGKMINSYLKGESQQEDHVIHLLFSANRWEAAAGIVQDIEAGITVVVDRYFYSGVVYSAAKDNPLLDLNWARHPEEGLPRPDLCLYLQLTAVQAAARGGWGDERYEKQEMQDRVRRLFGTLQASSDGKDMVTVDAGQSVEQVQFDINALVDQCLSSVDIDLKPLGRIKAW